MLFFLMLDKNGRVYPSLLLGLDKQESLVSCLSPPLPLAIIHKIQAKIQHRTASPFLKSRIRKDLKQEILSQLVNLCDSSLKFSWEDIELSPQANWSEYAQFDEYLCGRQLSTRDLKGVARELNLEEGMALKLADFNVEQGMAQWVPSVIRQGMGWRCQRCGQADCDEWYSLYGRAATCRRCSSIGPSTSIEVLYRDQRPLIDGPQGVNFQPHWRLTDAQRWAGEQTLSYIQGGPEERALLWAACGAGKTEVCFPAAAWALQQGKSVLFACPRQDVIHDILPRVQRDFPGFPLQVLTGKTSLKIQRGGFVLATTHQVLRFWQAFDVIFLDEMDAFPYQGSEALAWGLGQALRQGGRILYLTATPSSEMLKLIQLQKIKLIQLPARHHRRPLPIPEWQRSKHSLEPMGQKGCEAWSSQLNNLRRAGPVLIFVPKIVWVDYWIQVFRQQFPNWQIEGSYSSDPKRTSKIEGLIQGKYDLFVSTTILERGITLAKIQVVVLGADHAIFDQRALVQMAGRVGRTPECTEGRVIFISQQLTPSMKTAVRWIKDQNIYAQKLGLLDS